MSPDNGQSVLVALALGTNLGDREANFRAAITMLNRAAQIHVELASAALETDPVGLTDQPKFLNGVALLRTTLSPLEFLHTCHAIERGLGRIRDTEQRWGPRTIDLDVLIYGDLILNAPGLTLPHPRMLDREFVLAPLASIAPEIVIPGSDLTVSAALSGLRNGANRARHKES